jgi:hypothetical protein
VVGGGVDLKAMSGDTHTERERGVEVEGWGEKGWIEILSLIRDLRQPGSLDKLAGIESSFTFLTLDKSVPAKKKAGINMLVEGVGLLSC